MQIPQEILDYIDKQWRWDDDLKQDLILELLELPDGAEVNKSWCVTRYNSRRVNDALKADNRKRLETENSDAIRDFCHPTRDSDDPLDILTADDAIRERLDTLSPLLRATLEAVVIEGRTPEEVAAVEGTTANVIYKRIHDAKQILQGNKP